MSTAAAVLVLGVSFALLMLSMWLSHDATKHLQKAQAHLDEAKALYVEVKAVLARTEELIS